MPRSDKSIRLSGLARRDINRIATYTKTQWGERQKTKYLGDIQKKLKEVRKHPELGRDRSNLLEGLRSQPIGKHIIFYRDTKSALVIVRVLHQSMDPERHLGKDPEVSQ